MSKNIGFAWWWTGWHVFPIRTLIEYIRKDKKKSRNIKNIYWFWEKNSLEEKVAKESECRFIPVISGKLRREKSINAIFLNIIDIFKFLYWILYAIIIVYKNKIDIIFCKWWYVALPVVIAWWIMRKKIIVHESDTIMWLTNKIAAKFSSKNFSWIESWKKTWENVWQIISEDLIKFEKIDIKLSNLTKKTNILVSWWSQGSKYIYENILNLIKNNKDIEKYFNFFVILGTANQNLKESFENLNWVQAFDFLSQQEIGSLYKITDIWITRWWATSLEEQKSFNMKLIIVPLPFTWGNHQFHNAKYYQKKYDDILISQKFFSEKMIKDTIYSFIWRKKEEINKKEIKEKINKNIEKILDI